MEQNGNGPANFVINRITTFGVNIKDASLNGVVETETTLKTTKKTTTKVAEIIEKNPQISQ